MATTKKPVKLNGNPIADTSIRQPVLITMITLLAIVIGLLAYSTLPVNFLPDIDLPTIGVSIAYPGTNPDTMADQVAKPIEDQLATLSGLKHITSQSTEGNTQFTIEFNTGVSTDRALQDVRDKVNAVIPTLPTEVKDPVFQKFDPNQQAILVLAVASKSNRSPLEVRSLVDDVVVPRLQQAQGVGSITVNGGQERQINVNMDLDKLKAWGILPAQISNAIKNANSNRGLGSVTADNQDISLRAPSVIQQPQDIARIQVNGTKYRIGDVATIEDGIAEVKGYSRLNGQDSISLSIRRQSGTNLLQVADAVKVQMNSVFGENPDLTYIISSDQSTQVRDSRDGSIEEILIAVVSAMLVVLLFFRDLRNTITTVIGLPVIMIATFAAMSLFGITINIISLLALSVSVGLVIDDAIVVRENIIRHVDRGESPIIAASRGTSQVALSVLAMSLTVIAVFLPVTFTTGITGIIFKSFGITVASSMVFSLIEAFTLAPMLSAYFMHSSHKQAANASNEVPAEQTPEEAVLEEAETAEHGFLERFYAGLLRWTLVHRWVVVLVVIGVALFSIYSLTGLKFSFFPQTDSGEFALGYSYPPGTTLAVTDKAARRVEDVIRKEPAVESVQATIGGEGTTESATFSVKLKKGEETIAAEERMRPQLQDLPLLVFGKPSFQGANTQITSRDIQLSLQTARPLDQVTQSLLQIQQQTQGSTVLTDLDTTYKPGKPELQFYVDPTKIGDLGYTNDDIANSVRALINGDTASTFRENGKDYDIVVRLQQQDRAGIAAIQSISVPSANGNLPLSSIATVKTALGPTVIRRYDRLNQVLIGANVAPGNNTSEVQTALSNTLKQQQQEGKIPADIKISFVGQAANQSEGFGTLLIAMGLSVLFVYMVLAAQFGSFVQPLVIMMAMPFSFLGAFLALRVTGIDLSIFGMIGLIMLLGVVVKNSILLVDVTNQLIAAGLDKNAALEGAGAMRLRPILMTTIALVVGSLPSAIGLGEGAEVRRALSVVVIGGLITSMFMTLLAVPTIYSLVESIQRRVGGLFRRRKKDEVVAPVPVPASSPVSAAVAAAPAAQPAVVTYSDGDEAVIQNVPINGGNGRSLGNGRGNGGAETPPAPTERRETI